MTAYAAAIAIVAGLVVWVVFERRHLARVLDELEAHGHHAALGARAARTRP